MSMLNNAKKNKISKNPHVRYPNLKEIEQLLGIRTSKKYKELIWNNTHYGLNYLDPRH